MLQFNLLIKLFANGSLEVISLINVHYNKEKYLYLCNVYIVHLVPCDAMHCTVFVIVILSVCLSVRLSHSWTVSTWFDLRS